MCVSIRPAEFSKTIVSTWEVEQGIHAFGYKNRMKNTAGVGNVSQLEGQFTRSRSSSRQPRFDWVDLGYEPRRTPGNAMILPVPVAEGANIITDAYLLDTLGYKRILEDQAEAVQEEEMTRGGAKGISYGSRSAAVIVEFGPYEVVLAQSPMAAFDILDKVSDAKRPILNEEQLAAYEDWYPGWSLMMACFNNKDLMDAAPIVLVTPVRHSDYLFLPAIHGHSGGVPDLTESVYDDHTFIAGSCLSGKDAGNAVFYSDSIPDGVSPLLPKRVVGAESRGQVKQGDLVVKLSDVKSGLWMPERLLPPGAPF